jgi:hypothetical protein
MSVESTQVRLKLTNNKEILKQLKRNRSIKEDAKGEYFTIQFDSYEYVFRPGKVLTVNETIGKALIRSSAVIMGDHLTGDFLAGVEKIGSYEIGTEVAPEDEAKATTCNVCKLNCHTLPRLSRHVMTAHVKDRSDLYPEDEKPLPNEAKIFAGATDADTE